MTLDVVIVGEPSRESDRAVAAWFERFLEAKRPGTAWSARSGPLNVTVPVANCHGSDGELPRAKPIHSGNTTIGLRAIRIARGLSAEELAARAGLSPRTVYNLERRLTKPHRATRRVLAGALGIDPDDLMATKTTS